MKKMGLVWLLCASMGLVAMGKNDEEQEKPARGDLAPNLKMTEIFEGKKLELSSFAGKYIFIDFWATWCGPCQGPMEHLNKEAPGILKKWPDKVVLIGASIDDKLKQPKRACARKGWNKILQTHVTDDKAFNITGIPTAFLIGPDGKILWRGHPANFDLEKMLAELIKETGGVK